MDRRDKIAMNLGIGIKLYEMRGRRGANDVSLARFLADRVEGMLPPESIQGESDD